jgi:dolichol-phosphate mannosyltransferase
MIYILLPAYNEERDIETLLRRIQGAMQSLDGHYQVLVVNDGSTDGTLPVVTGLQNAMPIEVLDHGVNKGLGQPC